MVLDNQKSHQSQGTLVLRALPGLVITESWSLPHQLRWGNCPLAWFTARCLTFRIRSDGLNGHACVGQEVGSRAKGSGYLVLVWRCWAAGKRKQIWFWCVLFVKCLVRPCKMCVITHTHIHTCTHTHSHTHTHMHTHTQVHTHTRTHTMCVFVCDCVCLCLVFVFLCMCACVCACCVCVHVCARVVCVCGCACMCCLCVRMCCVCVRVCAHNTVLTSQARFS